MEAHHRALQFGGHPGIRDLGLIESAIARPYSGYYRPISKKAAALVQSLACNHGFVDGNKRTALFMMNTLLLRSGYHLTADSQEELNNDVEKMILDVVEHRLDFDGVAEWFEHRIQRR